jgi:hypothetical protein
MLATGDWWLHLDNTPMHTAAVVNNWMGARQFKIIQHPLYEPDLARLISFSSQGREGAGRPNLHPGDSREGVGRGWEIPLSGWLRQAFQRLCECCDKCLKMTGSYAEKTKIENALTITVFLLGWSIVIGKFITLYEWSEAIGLHAWVPLCHSTKKQEFTISCRFLAPSVAAVAPARERWAVADIDITWTLPVKGPTQAPSLIFWPETRQPLPLRPSLLAPILTTEPAPSTPLMMSPPAKQTRRALKQRCEVKLWPCWGQGSQHLCGLHEDAPAPQGGGQMALWLGQSPEEAVEFWPSPSHGGQNVQVGAQYSPPQG